MNIQEITKVENELAAFETAKRQLFRRMHFSTVQDAFLDAKFPYTLVQVWRDDLGNYLRNYRYRWTSKWNSAASLYIQETKAGRDYKSMWDAMDAIEEVLRGYLKSLKAA